METEIIPDTSRKRKLVIMSQLARDVVHSPYYIHKDDCVEKRMLIKEQNSDFVNLLRHLCIRGVYHQAKTTTV